MSSVQLKLRSSQKQPGQPLGSEPGEYLSLKYPCGSTATLAQGPTLNEPCLGDLRAPVLTTANICIVSPTSIHLF